MNRLTSASRLGALAVTSLVAMAPAASAQTAQRDGIAALLKQNPGSEKSSTQMAQANPRMDGTEAAAPADPRDGDLAYEQAQRLMKAVDAILQDTAKNRGEAKKLPSKNEFMVPMPWNETREDRERKIADLMDSVLGVVTDVPVVDVQKKIDALRKNIRDLDDRVVALREKQLVAPKDGMLPGIVSDTVDSLGRDIEETKKKIELNRAEIKNQKSTIGAALQQSGIQLAPEQVDLLLDGVLSGDLVKLVAVFSSAKIIDGQLSKLMAQTGENAGAARKYFAMHAALFAMLVHAQDMALSKLDTQYLPKLEAISKDVAAARAKTGELLRAENRPDQKRVLEANKDSQALADEAAKGYRKYLLQQREQIARARAKTTHDLRIADNTYETVEASFQLRNLMKQSTQSFEALQKLEAPTFEQIFKNEELRREFESLTRKLDVPAS